MITATNPIDRLFARVAHRILRAWCYVTGRDNYDFSFLLFRMARVTVVLHAVVTMGFRTGGLWMLWPILLPLYWWLLGFRQKSIRRLAASQSDTMPLSPVEISGVLWDRMFFAFIACLGVINVIAHGYPTLFDVFSAQYSLALYAGCDEQRGTKSLARRFADAAKKAAAKVGDLVPKPAPQPIPIPLRYNHEQN